MGPIPCPNPYHCGPKRGQAQSFVTCHTVSPSMGGTSPACHNKVYYGNRLVWGQGDKYIRLVGLGEVVRLLHIDAILAEGRGQVLHG